MLLGGSWLIGDHYLTVLQWQPNFEPESMAINRALVWVRLPNLLIEYYDKGFILYMGSRIRRLVKVDEATLQAAREKYARICVEVDFSKPPLPKFCLRRRVRSIKYEGIHLVYFACGCFGHRMDGCPTKEMSVIEASPVLASRATPLDMGGGLMHHPSESHKE